jgi:alpha-glucosidase
LFRFGAWEWSEKRQEYYLHQCIVEQPDLNYRNPNVVTEMNNVLLFWLEKGVDGFRIDAIPFIFETVNDDGSFPDEPVSGLCDDIYGTCYLSHIYTKDLPETYNLLYDWRDLVDNYTKIHGGSPKVLMTEAYTSLEKELEFYGNAFGRRGAHVPFNFLIIENINQNSMPVDYKSYIDAWLDNMPKESDYVPNWVVGNHDQHRVEERFGDGRGDAINMLVQTLPGIAVTYNGEELVMRDTYISYEDTVDPMACNQGPENYWPPNRDPARTPFQWDTSNMAGFTKANKTWLPVNSNYKDGLNVKEERAKVGSHLNVFKRLVQMRKTKAVLQDGSTEVLADNNLLIIKREISRTQLFTILNLGKADQNFTLSDYFSTRKNLVSASVVSDNAGIRQG